MAFKIYESGNYIFIELPSNPYRQGDVKQAVTVSRLVSEIETYWIQSPLFGEEKKYSLSDLVDRNNLPYTSETWETFYLKHTGTQPTSDIDGNIQLIDQTILLNTIANLLKGQESVIEELKKHTEFFKHIIE